MPDRIGSVAVPAERRRVFARHPSDVANAIDFARLHPIMLGQHTGDAGGTPTSDQTRRKTGDGCIPVIVKHAAERTARQ